MDTKQAWDVLLNLSVGQIAAWVGVVFAIISAICAATIKLYKIFTKYRNLKEENQEEKNNIQKHEESIDEIKNCLKQIQASLAEQREVNLKQIRYSIVHTCDDAIADGKIPAGKLRSLEEMFEEYVEVFHGNGYVKNLVDRVRQLPIVGKLDD